jgi:aminoglycoside 2''-phosphotransferase
MDTTLNGYAGWIHSAFPSVSISTIEWLASGQNSTALLVNGSIVFRFPRYADGIEQLRREVAILQLIGRDVPVPVPEPGYVNLAPSVDGTAFVGYAMLPGVPLSECTLDDVDARHVGSQLGAFLRHLHRMPVDRVHAGDRSPRWMVEPWERLYLDILDLLFPMMRPDACVSVSRHFETFLHDHRDATIDPVLIHGDFGASNVLYDASERTVSGVIDFGSARVGDPAIDIAAATTIHPAIRERLVQVYPADASMLRRADFYRGTFALQEAVFGATNGDEEALRAGLSQYA